MTEASDILCTLGSRMFFNPKEAAEHGFNVETDYIRTVLFASTSAEHRSLEAEERRLEPIHFMEGRIDESHLPAAHDNTRCTHDACMLGEHCQLKERKEAGDNSPFFVLDLPLDIVHRVRELDLTSRLLPAELDEDLHTICLLGIIESCFLRPLSLLG